MKNQTITKKNLAIIYSKVCEGWKKKIADVLVSQIDEDQITVESAILREAFSQANEDQKNLLKKYFDFKEDLKISDKVKDLESLCDHLEIKMRDILIFNKPKNAFEKYINACAIIPRITEAYNEGTKLDWTNNSVYKYIPYFKKGCSGWVFYVVSGYYLYGIGASACHYFKSSNLSDSSAANFSTVYIDYHSFQG